MRCASARFGPCALGRRRRLGTPDDLAAAADEIIGQQEGSLVILLHGFPYLWYLWRHQIKTLAAAGYRVVAPDQRGYGQSDAPADVHDYDQTHLVGDAVGLVHALAERSAILVGHDFGSWVGYYSLAMRPDLFRGLFMFCSPPSPRPTVSPVEAFKSFPDDLVFYQEYFARPGTAAEIMQDIRGYLTGLYYSVSGACSDDEQWRALWKKGSERFEDTYTVPVAGVHEPTGDGLCRQRIHSPRHPGRTQLVRCGASASTIFQ